MRFNANSNFSVDCRELNSVLPRFSSMPYKDLSSKEMRGSIPRGKTFLFVFFCFFVLRWNPKPFRWVFTGFPTVARIRLKEFLKTQDEMFNSFSFSMAESLSSEKKRKNITKSPRIGRPRCRSSAVTIQEARKKKQKNRKIGGYQKTRRRRCCPRAGTSWFIFFFVSWTKSRAKRTRKLQSPPTRWRQPTLAPTQKKR